MVPIVGEQAWPSVAFGPVLLHQNSGTRVGIWQTESCG